MNLSVHFLSTGCEIWKPLSGSSFKTIGTLSREPGEFVLIFKPQSAISEYTLDELMEVCKLMHHHKDNNRIA